MFRLGDFYEMFFEDAVVAAEILQIALTSRHKNSENETKMCGVPYHALGQYLSKLTKAGKKVAICDQVTQPDGKGIVEREVVRVVTPGTTFDENILDNKTNNYVTTFVKKGEDFALAYSDVTTGEFKVTELSGFKNLESELMRLNPAECILSEELLQENAVKSLLERHKSICAFPYYYVKNGESELLKFFELKSLKAFDLEGKNLAILAAAQLLEYLKETQKTDLKHLGKILYYELSQFMPLDEASIRNLELFFTNMGKKKEGSLIAVLDNTKTPMGGRLLRNWLLHPLLKKESVERRLNSVEVFVNDSTLLRAMRETLGGLYDMERLLSRLSLGSGNARDLVAMKACLRIIPEVKNLIAERGLTQIEENLTELPELAELIDVAIKEEAPLSLRDGGMINDGFNKELDELRGISFQGKDFIKSLQERESRRTGINSLKVKFNKVFGYYIEISKSNLAAVPEDYIRKQTLVNAERFITPELKEYEEKVLSAEDKIKELEYELFYGVRMEVVKEIANIQSSARALAELDVYSNFAFLAEKFHYCRPEILEEGLLEIKNGRHPVVERLKSGENFVANDCTMSNESNFFVITGPNMGGKSTYLRQVALIVLLAQIGSYVPAESAKISLVDRIFTRVGASDNLASGESTFMVEMQEAAYILNNATEKSLIIFDEVGRGTSTYDGVSIAWSITEFCHENVKAKTLFATHYHELIELADKLLQAKNMSVSVRENEKEGVVFLYKVVEGGVDKSYGIEVAKLAGLPVEVVSRARGVLKELESKHIGKKTVSPDQLDMFKEREAAGLKDWEREMLKDIQNVDVNNLTPLEALQKLSELKRRAKE